MEREEVFDDDDDEVFVSLLAEEEEEEEVLGLDVVVVEGMDCFLPLEERALGRGREETETQKRKGRRGSGERRFLEGDFWGGLLGEGGETESWERCIEGLPFRGMVPRRLDLPASFSREGGKDLVVHGMLL